MQNDYSARYKKQIINYYVDKFSLLHLRRKLRISESVPIAGYPPLGYRVLISKKAHLLIPLKYNAILEATNN